MIKKSNIKEEKLKPIRPSMRTKKRFVKLKIISKKKFDFKILSEEITDQLILFLGTIDYSKGGIWLLRDKFNEEQQELVLKVSTKFKDKALGAIALIQNIDKTKASVKILKISGTLKGLEKN